MKALAGISLIAILGGLALPTAAESQTVSRPGPSSGSVVAAKGGEQVRLAATAQWLRVVQGQGLKQGDVLRTNATGTLALLFADRTQVRLGPNASMSINAVAAGAPSQVTLSAGRAWGRSPRAQTNLRVNTPSATAAIRGTEWALSVDEDTTTLEVFEGEVELANELGAVLVGSGEAARVRRGQAPVKVTISNPVGREQMLYFVRAEDALAMMETGDERFAQARRHVYLGEWEQAAQVFATMRQSDEAAARAVGAYGVYVAAIQLGQPQAPLVGEDEPNAFLGRALVAAYAGDLAGALTTADAGLARFPDHRGLYRAKTRLALLLGQPRLADETISLALDRHPGDPDLLGLRAEYLADYAGSPRAALGVARRAAAARPEDADMQATLARIWLQLGGRKEALEAVDVALRSRPQDASLLALRGEILLARNEGEAANRSLQQALTLEPDLSIIRLGLAEYESRAGRRETALNEAMAASAGNPSFGRGFVALAELSYDDPRPEVALQQLDAANRLDSFSPAVPLARAAIALHRFDADGAIEGAREALVRSRGRGGEYSNLSENQVSGSLVSQSFRFLNLEGWGRYYGDRAFDSFSPVSYPDQALNRVPSPFLVRADDGSFNAFSGADEDFVSSFLQGAVLAPLSVVDARKELLFSRRNFFEAAVGGSWLTESRRSTYEGSADATGIVNGAVPFGYNISFRGLRSDDGLPQVDISPLLDQRRSDDHVLQGLFGFELTPQDRLISIVRDNRGNLSSRFDNRQGALPGRPAETFTAYDLRTRDTSAALFWQHELGYRNAFTVGGLYSRRRGPVDLDLPSDDTFRAEVDTGVDHLLLSANYARSFGLLDLRTGIELSRYDLRDDTLFQSNTLAGFLTADDCVIVPEICDMFGFDGELFNIASATRIRYEDLRPYLDMRLEIGNRLIVQGQASYLRRDVHDRSDGIDPDVAQRREDHLNYQVGAALEPVSGQWFRAATVRRTATDQDFTFAPIAAVGLRPTNAPLPEGALSTSHVARWDAEWTPRLFTSVEYEHRKLGALYYKVPSTEISVRGGGAELERVAAEANLWLRGNLGVRLAYSHVVARAKDFYTTSTLNPESGFEWQFGPGDRLPYVPEQTGQLALTWTRAAPWRARAELSADYLGDQIGGNGEPLSGYMVVNLKSEFEPLARALRIEASVFNLLDKRFIEGGGIAGPGRTLRIAMMYRF